MKQTKEKEQIKENITISHRINPSIFREYDIRGVVDKDLNDETVLLLAKGIISFLEEKDAGRKIIIGRDNRLSSNGYRNIIIDELLTQGYDVIDIGEVPTPVMYYSLRHFNVPAGIMITGSHNPPSFNGFKVAINNHCIWGEDIKRIQKIIEDNMFDEKSRATYSKTENKIIEKNNGKKGNIEKKDAISPYIFEISSRLNLGNKRKLKVVTDAGNGMAGGVAPELLRKLGAEVIELFSESDGTYPNHHPDPTQPKEYNILIDTVKKEKADIGLAFDGDADRLGAIDETGKMLFGDELLILFSREILKKNPGATICMEVKCSQGLIEDIKSHGGNPHITPTGHSIIENELEKTGALLAGEMSGHIYFNDEWYGFDDSIYSAARLLRILSNEKKQLSCLFDDAPKYVSTPELRITVPDEKKFGIVEKIKEHFKKDFEVISIDGVRFSTDEGWGLVRASNTQPALVIRAEAKTEEGLKRIKGLLEEQLKKQGINMLIE